MPTQAEALIERQKQMSAIRAPHEQDWRDIRDLIRPVTGEFNPYGVGYTPAQRSVHMYDGTAPDACEGLASGLHSFLTNPVERWFELEAEGLTDISHEGLVWLEYVSDKLYSAINDERAMFNPSVHEGYLDISSFGTGTVSVEMVEGHLQFKSFPLADVWFEEDAKGKVSTLFRRVRWTRSQVGSEFGEKNLPPKLRSMNDPNMPLEIYHVVMTRGDRDVRSHHAKQMRFGSYWLCVNTAEIIHESGYHSFPYMVPRWYRLSGETYGKGPSYACLPDVKMLNRMEYTIIKAAEKMVDPPLMVPDDGFLTPIRTSPGALLYKEPGSENIEPLLTGANIPIGLEISNQKRDHIRKCFHIDWIQRDKKRERQTQFEVADERDEMLRMMSPMLGRLETELLGPLIGRAFSLLDATGAFPPAPQDLRGGKIKPSYVSPAAQAQQSQKAVTMGRFAQDIATVAAIKPDVLDAFNGDAYVQELAATRMVSRKVVNTPEQIEVIRAERQQQEQMAQAATAAEPVSKAAVNFAKANEMGGNVTAPLP